MVDDRDEHTELATTDGRRRPRSSAGSADRDVKKTPGDRYRSSTAWQGGMAR